MSTATRKTAFQLVVGWDPGYGNGKAVLVLPAIYRGPFETREQAASWLAVQQTPTRSWASGQCAVTRGPGDWTGVPPGDPSATPGTTWYIADPF